MKFLHPDTAYNPSATSSATNYPAANVLTAYPQEVWAASTTTGTLTVYLDSTSDAVALINVKASAGGTLTVTDTVTSTVLVSETLSFDYVTDYSDFVKGLRFEWKNWWAEWTCTGNVVRVDIALTDSTAPEIGIVQGGPAFSYNNPEYGAITQSARKAFSQVELNNYSMYCERRKFAQKFSGTVFDSRAELLQLFNLVAGLAGTPLPFLLIDGLAAAEKNQFVFYGAFDDNFNLKHAYYDDSLFQFSLEEAI